MGIMENRMEIIISGLRFRVLGADPEAADARVYPPTLMKATETARWCCAVLRCSPSGVHA